MGQTVVEILEAAGIGTNLLWMSLQGGYWARISSHVALCSLQVAWCPTSSIGLSGGSFAKTLVKTLVADSKPWLQLQIKWGCTLACYST